MTRFLCENFFDTAMFGDHTVTGQDESTGHEGWRVGSGRRSSRNYYQPATTNVQRYLEVACDQVRAADMLVLDRGHNLGGQTVRLWASNESDFTTYTEVFSATVPTQAYGYTPLTAGQPVLTAEGAIVVKFAMEAAAYWRVVVDAMGTGLAPQIVGAYLGLSWAPTNPALLPWDDEPRDLAFSTVESSSLWAASGQKALRRSTQPVPITIKLASESEYSQARYHIHDILWGGYNAWYVPQDEAGERTWMGYAPAGNYAAPQGGDDRMERTLAITLVEQEPKLR